MARRSDAFYKRNIYQSVSLKQFKNGSEVCKSHLYHHQRTSIQVQAHFFDSWALPSPFLCDAHPVTAQLQPR